MGQRKQFSFDDTNLDEAALKEGMAELSSAREIIEEKRESRRKPASSMVLSEESVRLKAKRLARAAKADALLKPKDSTKQPQKPKRSSKPSQKPQKAKPHEAEEVVVGVVEPPQTDRDRLADVLEKFLERTSEEASREEVKRLADPSRWTPLERYNARVDSYNEAVRTLRARIGNYYVWCPFESHIVAAAGRDLTDDDLPVTFDMYSPEYKKWKTTETFAAWCERNDVYYNPAHIIHENETPKKEPKRDTSPLNAPTRLGFVSSLKDFGQRF